MNSVRSNSQSLKYQRFKLSAWKDIGFRKFEFVAKTQFLCKCLDQTLEVAECHDAARASSTVHI